MPFEISLDQTKQLLKGNNKAAQWHNAFERLFPKYEINTPQRVAGFIAQCGHESNNFKIVEENLNYSATRLNQVFPKYFKKAGRDAKAYARQPEKIANLVYGNRMDNGPPESGDGYRFRGRGPIQLTGRYNYTQFGKSIGKTADQVAEYMETIEGALESALWFWEKNNLNSYCDRGDIKGMTKRINGGYNGLSDRETRWNHALGVLGTKIASPSSTTRTIVLKRGSSGGNVRKVQMILGIEVDGRFGPATEEAVKRYQKRKGLTVDGVVGPETLRRMEFTNV